MSAKPSHDEALHSFLYRALLEKIISGEIAPGQRLVEEDLARTYGVSRTPIREVLLSLVKDGCVERARNCGARVVAFKADLKLHHLIVENSGNRRLIAQMRNLSLLLESLQLTSFSNDEQARKTGEQHLSIVRALLQRDVVLARRLLTEHIEYGKRNVLQMFIKFANQQQLVARE